MDLICAGISAEILVDGLMQIIQPRNRRFVTARHFAGPCHSLT